MSHQDAEVVRAEAVPAVVEVGVEEELIRLVDHDQLLLIALIASNHPNDMIKVDDLVRVNSQLLQTALQQRLEQPAIAGRKWAHEVATYLEVGRQIILESSFQSQFIPMQLYMAFYLVELFKDAERQVSAAARGAFNVCDLGLCLAEQLQFSLKNIYDGCPKLVVVGEDSVFVTQLADIAEICPQITGSLIQLPVLT